MKTLDYLENQINKKSNFKWIHYSIDEVIFSDIKLDENYISQYDFMNIFQSNQELFNDYVKGGNLNILNNMINFNIKEKRICTIEELDNNLVDEKTIFLNNILEYLENFDYYSDSYTIYMLEPFSITSPIQLVYIDCQAKNLAEPNKEYSYLLETFIIRDELISLYIEELVENNIYSIENLGKMIIYYGDNDAHMEIDRILHPEIDYPIVKGGYAIWGKKQKIKD